ncbi:guanylate cyclase 32E-like [Varroa jacobsoni]|nr:guanylate cyclase 32E-like [Varroa jacobsoni]
MSRSRNKPEIKIGFLGTFYQGRMLGKLVVGAMPLAVHDVNQDEDVLPDHRLTFVAENVGQPEGSGGVKKMTDLRNQAVKAFIGPDESCFAEALVADAWNMPMITYMCYDQRVSRGKIFKTFARTLPSSSKVSKSVIALLKYFEWTRVTLVVAESTTYVQTHVV